LLPVATFAPLPPLTSMVPSTSMLPVARRSSNPMPDVVTMTFEGMLMVVKLWTPGLRDVFVVGLNAPSSPVLKTTVQAPLTHALEPNAGVGHTQPASMTGASMVPGPSVAGLSGMVTSKGLPPSPASLDPPDDDELPPPDEPLLEDEPELLDEPPEDEPEPLDEPPPEDEPELLDEPPPEDEPEPLDEPPPEDEPELLDEPPPEDEPEPLLPDEELDVASAPSPSAAPPSETSPTKAAPPHATASTDESPTVILNAKRCPKPMFDSPRSHSISHARGGLGYPTHARRTLDIFRAGPLDRCAMASPRPSSVRWNMGNMLESISAVPPFQ
jgi:outer membrane biosynthesis protein TonB